MREDSVTGPIEESAVATVAEWPDGLAAVLTGAVDQARAAVVEFSGAEAVGDYLGVSYEDPSAATHRFLAHLPGLSGLAVGRRRRRLPRRRPRHDQRSGAGPGADGVAGARVGALGAAGAAGGFEPRRPAGTGGRRPAAGSRLHRQR